jgi:hypothetical protein
MAEARLTHDLSSPVNEATDGAPEEKGGPVGRFTRRVRAVNDRYASEQPLPAFAGIIATYSTVVLALSAGAWRRRRLPDRVPAQDLLLYSVATHKVARIIAKDPVTSPLRAPFTTLDSVSGPAELHEEVTGRGWRRAVGELLTCPFCLAQWVGTGFVFGGMFFPRATRAVAATFVVHAASDALQFGYAALERTDGPSGPADARTTG